MSESLGKIDEHRALFGKVLDDDANTKNSTTISKKEVDAIISFLGLGGEEEQEEPLERKTRRRIRRNNMFVLDGKLYSSSVTVSVSAS